MKSSTSSCRYFFPVFLLCPPSSDRSTAQGYSSTLPKRRLSQRGRDPSPDGESVTIVEDEDSRNKLNAPDDDDSNPTAQLSPFSVVITTYEMIIKDRVYLAKYD